MVGFCESLAVLPYLFDQGVLLKYVAGMEFYIRAEKNVFVAISPGEDAQACGQQRKT